MKKRFLLIALLCFIGAAFIIGMAIAEQSKEKMRAEIIDMPDMSGAKAMQIIFIYDDTPKVVGILIHDKYGNLALSIGETGLK